MTPSGHDESGASELRKLPSVDRVLAALDDDSPHDARADAVRAAVADARRAVARGGHAPSVDDVAHAAAARLAARRRALLGPVINATGVIVHTNLGRVPLGRTQLDAVARVARGYSNLEYDVARGGRGRRHDHAATLLRELTGAEAALVVNNNAAAVLVVLAALCAGRDVVISRGELVEIGGEFRIPDVMAASGARLVEVGTTNRTHLADYERALGPDTAAILKVHPSNYRVVGFTASVADRDVARLARGRGVPFLYDLGSGLVEPPGDAPWSRDEPRVADALAAGADVVTFSGDKLLGGPQAGVIVGRARLVETIARHPLVRAVRPGKMTLAALEATLDAYLSGRAADLPLWGMALAAPETLEARASALASALDGGAGVKAEAVPTRAVTGGGSLPGAELGSWAVALTHPTTPPDELDAALRAASPPVIARTEDDRVLLDVRTIAPDDDERLLAAARSALTRPPPAST
ncbi:MAG TPA: L-seryl-tRNA(Sec) selenium transferase [Actinomycetota bacterium]|nr:L-seryl-tRNA(Sec) selenium transferase [Actinomycetota bacterium]